MRSLLGMVVLVAACSSKPAPERPASQSDRGLLCLAGDQSSTLTEGGQPLLSVAICRATAEADSWLPGPSRSEIRTSVIDLRGPRDWREIQVALDEARLLMSLCYRRWYRRQAPDRLAVVAVVGPSGRVDTVRSERDDGLGRCIAEVVSSVELSPDGFDRGSTDVLANIEFVPSPWTQWAAR